MAKGGRKKVGEAYVELRADSSKIQPELEKLRSETQKTAKQVEGDTKRIGDGFDNVGKKVEKSTEGFRKFSGAISSTIGIWTGIAGAISLVVGLLAAAAIGIKKFADAHSAMPKARREIEKTRESLDRMRESYDALTGVDSEARTQAFLAEARRIDDAINERLKKALNTGGPAGAQRVLARDDEYQSLLVERSRLNQLAARGVRDAERARAVEQESPAEPTSTRAPIDIGGPIRTSPGGLDATREFLDLLREIARNTRDPQQ